MKTNPLKNIGYVFALLFTLSSCTKDDDKVGKPIEEEAPATIYVSGYSNEISNLGEVIWKNGTPMDVYQTGMLSAGYVRYGGVVNDMDISNNDIYAVWRLNYKALTAFYPTAHIYYWKSGQNTQILANDYNSYPNAVDRHGESLYFAGYYTAPQSYPSIWKDGIREQLPGGIGVVNDLLVNDTQVMAVGYVNVGQLSAAAIWQNGVLTKLGEGYGFSASAIAQTGNDIYIAGAGSINGINDPLSAFLWKNGTRQVLPLQAGQLGAAASAVALANNKTYAVGYSYNRENSSERATLWIDGSPVTLSAAESKAASVAVKDQTVYACGYEKPGNRKIAVMWKIRNGKVETTKLSAGTEDADATCIKVK